MSIITYKYRIKDSQHRNYLKRLSYASTHTCGTTAMKSPFWPGAEIESG